MKNKITVRRYQKSDFTLWNSFVNDAKNGTFLFHRDFMEYHQDRFEDFSLMLFNQKEKLIAVLPANRGGDTIFSHQGLTYGGLVLGPDSHLSDSIQMTYYLLKYVSENNYTKLNIKVIPAIYNSFPSDEMEYIAFLLDSKLKRRDALAVVDLDDRIEISRVRKRGIEKGVNLSLKIIEENDFTTFWNELLIPNLKSRYDASPVHSLSEITYLKSKFPNEIKQFNVYLDDKIIGGATVFFTKNVIHPQYISGNKEFNNTYGGLDFLYHFLLNELDTKARYFDFGISNENNGMQLNESLHYWKESFGARTIVQNFYEIETKNYSLLEQVLI
jgi:hypothetical protein